MTTNPRVMKYCNQSDVRFYIILTIKIKIFLIFNNMNFQVFFKRHCAVADWMEQNINKFDYILFIDADIGVINPCHEIQEYIDNDPNVEIAFYDRYYDNEIAAGSYLARLYKLRNLNIL